MSDGEILDELIAYFEDTLLLDTDEDESFGVLYNQTLFTSYFDQTDPVDTFNFMSTNPTQGAGTGGGARSSVEAFLGQGNAPLQVDRTLEEISEHSKTFPKDARAALKTSDFKSYLRMVETCKKGIDNKFALLEPITEDSGVERLKLSYNVLTRLIQLRKEMENCDIDDVFIIPISFDGNGIPDTTDHINLLETDHDLTLDLVKQASALYALKSPLEYHPQNVAWSGDKVLASCEADLKEKVIEQAESKVDKALHGGPIYLFIMRRLIIATSEKAMRGLTERIGTLKLSNFDGENVHMAGSYLKGAFTLLTAHDRMPKDVNLLLFRVFKESSTPDFNSFVTSIEQQLETATIFGNTKTLTPEEIIGQFETKYSDLIGRDAWEAKSTSTDQASAFTAGTSSSTVICFNCGGLGHTVPECKLPRDEEAIKARRDLILKSPSKGGGGANSKRGGGRGSGDRGGKKGGRGDAGRGNGGRGGGGNSSGLKTPPKAGESHKKQVNGSTLYWCGRCGKWGDHDTSNHPTPSGGKGSDKSSSSGNDDASSTSNAEGNLASTLSFKGAMCGSLN